MDRVEEDVGELKTEVARTTSSVDGLRGDMSILFSKMDQVITGTVNQAATKDMIPTKYVTWAIGLALSTLLTMIGLGVSVTGAAGAVVLWAMNSGDDKLTIKVEDQHELVMAEMRTLSDDVTENRNMHEDVEARLRVREQEAFTAEDGRRLEDRVNLIERQATSNGALAMKAWDEIMDHEDELDHPIRQTFEGEARGERIEQLEEQLNVIRDRLKPETFHAHPHTP